MDGNQPRPTEKTTISSTPVKNVGTENPTVETKGADLVEPAILAIGREDADGYRDKNADDVGESHDPKRLRQALDDQVHDRGARLPAQHAEPPGVARVAEQGVEHVQRLVDEKLLAPQEIADVDGLAEA